MVLNITNSTFDHNKSGGNGGAIYASSYNDGSMITLNGCEFSYNYSGLSGGGVLFEGNSSLQGTNRFHHNTALRNGGGISIEGYSQQTTGQAQTINFNLNSGLELDNNYSPCGAGLGINLRASVGYGVGSTINITVDGSNIHDNQASTDYDIGDAHLQGGGIYILNNLNPDNNYTVNVNLNGCKIKDNVAGMGAGVFVVKANVIGDGTGLEISGNKANVASSNLIGGTPTPENWNCGGGVVVQSGDLKLKNGVVKSNVALVNGGGAAVLGGGLEIDGCQVGANGSSNKAVKGGGMFVKGGNFTINSGSIQYNNDATIQNGAGIYVQGGNAYVQGGSVSNNKSQAAGAGIYVEGGSVEVSGGSVESNQSPTDGGGIYLSDGTNPGSITISGGSIASNTAANNGGGFYVGGGSVIITGGSITGNNATNANGGGFYVAKGNVNVTNGTISGNMANKGRGGGFYTQLGNTTIDNHSAIKTNYAQYGAGLYVNGALDITDTEISGNQATYDGGGVYSNAGELTIHTGVIVTGNYVQQDGGGFFVNDEGNITMAGGSISGNSADRSGGGIYTKGNFDLGDGINDCTLNGNTAGHNGGAVYVEDGEIVIKNALVSGNTANGDGSEGGGKGGGIYCGGTLTLNSGTIQKNGAREGGGIFMATKATMTFYDGIVKENTAVNGGGVYNSREAKLNLIKSAQIINNKCYNNYDGGMGGGIYQNGFLNVAGTQLKVQNNKSESLSSSTPVVNNVFLPEDGNFITVVDWVDPDTQETIKGLSGSEVWIGISVPTVPHAVVHSETPDAPGHIKDFYNEAQQAFTIFLKDDINRYSAVYADKPYPYNHQDIFFTGTWQIGALDLLPEPPEGQTKTFSDGDLGDQTAVDAYFGNIDSEGKLARFMCYVNGLNGYSPHPSQSGKVTADLYMERYVWLPIGADDGTNQHPHGDPQPYTGTFDGNGHIISGLKTIALAGLKYYGLFGRTNSATVKNTFVIDCSYYSNSEDDRIGCIIGEMIGGRMYYSEGAGKLFAEGIRAIMGGLAGYVENAEIHSCMAMPAMECNGANAIMGGLVGKMLSTNDDAPSGSSAYCTLSNCFANPQFRTTSSTAFGGGLVGVMDKSDNDHSHTRTSECYVRLDREHIIPETN